MYITSIGTDDTQGRDRKKNGTHCHHADRDWWRKGKWYGRPYHAPLSVGTAASARYYDLERAKVKLGSSFGHSLAVNVTSYRNCVRGAAFQPSGMAPKLVGTGTTDSDATQKAGLQCARPNLSINDVSATLVGE